MYNINKRLFISLISKSSFKELFITELGWNNFRGMSELPPITIDDRQYCFNTIAERSGFQILTCTVDVIPTNSICKKIDTKLRKQANDYIAIYRLKDSAHHLWVVPVKTNEKRDLVLVEYETAEKADLLYSKIEGFSFELGEQTTIIDLRNKVQSAFAINSEKITKDFYTGFKKEHNTFTKFISGINDDTADKNNKDKQWYASIMLNRLMFCYFIQKKGFLDSDANYLSNKFREYVENKSDGDSFYDTFYKDFLKNLFSDGLNRPNHDGDNDFRRKYGKIPYLNGGMFSEHDIEKKYADINIDDEAFKSLFDFFDKWCWHLDTRITASGKDINPDVLGYIFEQYINDRAQKGAYYTKEDITEYIGRSCILPFLFDKVAAKEPKSFKSKGFVWQTLRNSGDRYIFDAVKKGYDHFNEIPENISRGIITENMKKEYSETPVGELPPEHIPLSELRSEWNKTTPEKWGLPTEIWRETIERLQRCRSLMTKIDNGEITSINDFITYNLDIRLFATDLLTHGDNLFVKHFYEALQNVTILDPTCGSGAFLFAAMNILEPLYESCIDRMQEDPADFKAQLNEIKDRYRSNIQYFIYKSIILRNLYGVDIMKEATEIAKLRLFLKMVAVVEADRRLENMGLDPLPDIDFNIRCGNTLVGYATEEDLNKELNEHHGNMEIMWANEEFKSKIISQMDTVSKCYETFKKIQLSQDVDNAEFATEKEELKKRLAELNELLNRQLFKGTHYSDYEEWKQSHQPFHWLAEFYSIIHDNGGFDVIIGNPPYVVYDKKKCPYKIDDNYVTQKSSNLYAFVFERSFVIGKAKIGLIIQMSSIGTESMVSLQSFLLESNLMYYSCFPERPKQLFEGACIALSIIMCDKSYNGDKMIFGGGINRTTDVSRSFLFKSLKYIQISKNDFLQNYLLYPKFKHFEDVSILRKIKNNRIIEYYLGNNPENIISYRSAGGRYWKLFLTRPFFGDSLSNKTKKLNNSISNKALMAILNSDLFWWYYTNYFDLYNLAEYMVFNFRFSNPILNNAKQLENLGFSLMESFESNRSVKSQCISSKQKECSYDSFVPRKSKPIIDQIDTVLAKHYGFTEEELDYIINYDIKYRMGDDIE